MSASPRCECSALQFTFRLPIQERIFPELRLFPDDASRKEAWRSAYTKNESLFARSIFVLLPVSVAAIALLHLTGASPPIASATSVVISIIGFPLLGYFCRRSIRQKLRLELHYYGVRVCIECGHQLGSTESRICPECGSATFGNRAPPN